ncbi:MAG TPA: tyrosine--tRNA ligase [Frankiaceae bacterium]|nr:tyrosine--tRNA ligase [Frankiaceae bacterium]
MTADVLDELTWRGQVAQTTDPDALRALLATGPVTLYAGFDPTADSLHVGSLVPILALRRFQLAGHRPIALVGGATGLVGDPSGRGAERALNDADTVKVWKERLAAQLGRFLDLDGDREGPGAGLLVDNLEWTAELPVLDFLRDVGKHFPVNQMLAQESVGARLTAGGISFTEFSYMLLQALDFLELSRRYGCLLQVGGSDQWGNITAGLDLIRRVDGVPAHGLTVHLLTKADGTKFGKTEAGTVWLDPHQTSPYAFFQFWVNTDDRDVVPFLRTFTFLPREEIDALAVTVARRPQAREAQHRLAVEVTTLVHGAAETARVVAASAALFGRGDLRELDEQTLAAALAEAGLTRVEELPGVVELLVRTGLCASRSDARRVVAQRGAYVDNRVVVDGDAAPTATDLLHGRYLVLRRGRRAVAGVERRPAGG